MAILSANVCDASAFSGRPSLTIVDGLLVLSLLFLVFGCHEVGQIGVVCNVNEGVFDDGC